MVTHTNTTVATSKSRQNKAGGAAKSNKYSCQVNMWKFQSKCLLQVVRHLFGVWKHYHVLSFGVAILAHRFCVCTHLFDVECKRFAVGFADFSFGLACCCAFDLSLHGVTAQTCCKYKFQYKLQYKSQQLHRNNVCLRTYFAPHGRA